MGRAGAAIVLERDLGALRVYMRRTRPQTQLRERRTLGAGTKDKEKNFYGDSDCGGVVRG